MARKEAVGTVEACRDSRVGVDIVRASERRMETTKQLISLTPR